MDKDRDIEKSLEDFKDIDLKEEHLEIIGDLAEAYSGKSEDDIFVEIIKLNEEMKSEMDPEEYKAVFEKLERIRPFLDDEQQKKLDRILKVLKRE